MNLAGYYRDPSVRSRLLEFLGGPPLSETDAVYITAGDGVHHPPTPGLPVSSLWPALESGAEIARSLWDRSSLIAHLDIEYVNFDHPLEAYQCPSRAFRAQAPVVQSVEEHLVSCGISALHLISGRGHHFVWRISRASRCFERLAALGAFCASRLSDSYSLSLRPGGESVGTKLGAAYGGLGMLMEFLGHKILAQCRPHCPMSVQLTAVEAGPPADRGREVVSIDLSEYGDPLHHRTIRVPFGAYLKTRKWFPDSSLEPMAMIPHHEVDEEQALSLMRDLEQTAKLARRASVQIPEQSQGSERLLDSYLSSDLADFHQWYYSRELRVTEHRSKELENTLPPCLTRILEEPNDWLLKPAAIQLLVRALWALGWHPREIAGLILSKYLEDRGWRPGIHFHDPSYRADFYTRLFSGLLFSRHDNMIDFNCRSTQEKGYCPQDCGFDPLLPLAKSALARRESCRETVIAMKRTFP